MIAFALLVVATALSIGVGLGMLVTRLWVAL